MTRQPTARGAPVLLLLSGLAALAVASRQPSPAYDLLVRNALIVDGTGRPAFRGSIGIRAGRIVQVGTAAEEGRAEEVVDVGGLAVAPGFIDVHTHADDLADRPLAENLVRMGVTSIVAGNCGGSVLDVGGALARLRRSGASVNFATLVGHNTVRREVMGTEDRAPTPLELARMKALVAKAMAEGAVGLSTGLQYVPGTYAEPDELIELAKIAAAAGGLYASHMRNEGTEIERAVAETIAVGEAARCPVQISHLKIDAPSRWGASATALALIDEARRRGLDVRADLYVYTAASSTLGIRFPSWVLEGGQARILERLHDETSWARIKREMVALLRERGLEDYDFAVVAAYRPKPDFNGKSIKTIARETRGSASLDAQLEVMREMLAAGGAAMVYHFMSEDDIGRILRHPQVMIASDSAVLAYGDGVPHPRGYGNNPRVLARYVRERGLLGLEEAVRKMTSLPAEQFDFADRGRIAPGFAADLVVFDPKTVADRATFEQPHQYPAGIPFVLVNGVFVVRDGRHTGARPGVVLRSARQRAPSHGSWPPPHRRVFLANPATPRPE
jgi:N-acyl-D-amino-acid deacylase